MADFDELKIPTGQEFLTVKQWNGLAEELNYARRIFLTIDGKLGIGTGEHDPKGPLHILHVATPPGGLPQNENGLLLGTAGTSEYKWIQSYGGSLSLNPKGNNVGIGTSEPNAPLSVVHSYKAQIEFKREKASGAIEQNNNGGALRLQDPNNKTLIQLRTYGVSYFNGGRIGIGNENPAAKLEIVGGVIISGSSSTDSLLQLFTHREDLSKGANSGTIGSGNEAWMILSRNKNSRYDNKKDLLFAYFNDQQWQTSLVIKHTNGNVGIGTLNPSEKLHVNGHIYAGSIKTSSPLIEFHTINSSQLKKSSNGYFYYDTNKLANEWGAGIVGFNTGSADIDEHDTGTFMRMYMEKRNNKWRVVASLRTHEHDAGGDENWVIYTIFVKKGITN